MKTLKLIALGIILSASTAIEAQVSINLNIGNPPGWAPAGYSNVDYYYLPDIEAYYDNRSSVFIYFNGGRWIRSRNLPPRYSNYDLYGGYKVVLNDYHGSRPYANFNNDRNKYRKGYKGIAQKSLRARPGNSRNNQYSPSRGRDDDRGRDNRGRGDDRGHDNRGGKDKKGRD